MSVSTTHPDYDEAAPLWELVRLTAKGQSAIKKQQIKFLPKSNGMLQLDASVQREVYAAYLNRSEFPNWVQDALRTATGLISKQMPDIQLPKVMEPLLVNATADGFGLVQMYNRSCNDVMETGRACLLADIDGNGQPYIAVYNAESVINWQVSGINGRQDLTLLVLQEQRRKPSSDRYGHEYDTVYRVLSLNEDGYCVSELLDENNKPLEEIQPYLTSSGHGLTYIPAVITGSTDNSTDVDKIPLLTMAYASVKYYQLSADYYQELHHTAHPQPYIIGMDEGDVPKVTGAFTAWLLPMESSCGYLEINGTGIEAKRTAMQDQKSSALEAGAKVMDTSQQESGEARKARQSDQYASLASVVTTVAEGVEQVLTYIAELIGASDEVTFSVKPEFSAFAVDTAMLQQLVNWATMGKISDQTVWDYLQTGKIPERAYDDERLLINSISLSDMVE